MNLPNLSAILKPKEYERDLELYSAEGDYDSLLNQFDIRRVRNQSRKTILSIEFHSISTAGVDRNAKRLEIRIHLGGTF